METLTTNIANLTSDEIISIEPLSSGFCSSTQKVIGKKAEYVLRNASVGTPGFEYLSDSRGSFEISHLMYLNAEAVNHVKSFGIFEQEEKIYHLQEFKQGQLLGSLGDLDDHLINLIATKIGEIHKIGRKITQKNVPLSEQKGKYLRSCRKVLTHQELTFSIYENYPSSPQDKKMLQQLIQFFMHTYFTFIENCDPQRITTLHGDFWNGNMIYDGKEVFFIDFSRLGYGEA